jgi:K+ potassium transporter integral membrane domain/Domain of unknown function (DUF4010)
MVAQILKSKAKSAFPTHSTWLSTQSTTITIVTLSGERRVGSVSRSIRKKPPLGALAIGALGVVYGDIGTSPLNTLKTALDWGGGATPEVAIGILSSIVRTLLLTTSIKYVAVVMRADNDGEGGILPLVPDRPMGPYGALNPHSIWVIVILIMAISAAGYVAVRLLGTRFGLPVAGLASGFISSTATIAAMGARAAKANEVLASAVAGAVLSTIATIVQLALVLARPAVSHPLPALFYEALLSRSVRQRFQLPCTHMHYVTIKPRFFNLKYGTVSD